MGRMGCKRRKAGSGKPLPVPPADLSFALCRKHPHQGHDVIRPLAVVGLGAPLNQGSSTTWLFDMTPHRGRVGHLEPATKTFRVTLWLSVVNESLEPEANRIAHKPNPNTNHELRAGSGKPPSSSSSGPFPRPLSKPLAPRPRCLNAVSLAVSPEAYKGSARDKSVGGTASGA